MSWRLGDVDGGIGAALDALRESFELDEQFPPEVEADASAAIESHTMPEVDHTDIPFVTIDPLGATDLDQALFLERGGDGHGGEGYRVWYAIADVASFVELGGVIDTEARERGQTVYAPDGRIPLHPTSISEDAGSLLPGLDRSAYVWQLTLDAQARLTETALTRARVRSRAQHDYDGVQWLIDRGGADDSLQLLKEVGEKRIALERERGGASLRRADTEVLEKDGQYTLELRQPLDCEAWNAQISLLTGMAAAQLMLDGGIGVLRTMPPADDESVARFRRQAAGLGTPWPTDMEYGEYLRRLDPANPRHRAITQAAASLFRGAGYTAFDGQTPENSVQAAIAAPYAHATAPLRRLVDRFVLLTCDALANGREVEPDVRAALPLLPELMASSDGRVNQFEAAAVNIIEAAVLAPHVGEMFEVTVIALRNGGGTVQLADPAVTSVCDGDLENGSTISARLIEADVATGTTRFVADSAPPARANPQHPDAAESSPGKVASQ